jgi:hypothetical protein
VRIEELNHLRKQLAFIRQSLASVNVFALAYAMGKAQQSGSCRGSGQKKRRHAKKSEKKSASGFN